MDMTDDHALVIPPERLRRTVDPRTLGFALTTALPAPTALVGQERAVDAIAFSLALKDQTYNLYASGSTGSGRSTAVMRAVTQMAQGEPAGRDWLYVCNFEKPGEPLTLALPAGEAPAFARDIDTFVATCRHELLHAFTSDDYLQQRTASLKSLEDERQQALDHLRREAIARGFLVQITPAGVATIPLKPSEAHAAAQREASSELSLADAEQAFEPMSPAEFEALPEEEQQRINAASEALQSDIAQALTRLQHLGEEAHARLRDLDGAVAQRVVAPLAEPLVAYYQTADRVVEYIHQLVVDIVAHADMLLMTTRDVSERHDGRDAADGASQQAGFSESAARDEITDSEFSSQEFPAAYALLRRYRVNVLVTRQESHAAPIVQEINPTFANLVGHIEFGLRHGLPVTDHLMLKPGAFHAANGGYLILHARDLFAHPGAWQAIKRTLRFGVISIEDGEDAVALPASAALRPEPIPVKMKVILIGDPETYAMLQALDPEFSELFKVRADFDRSIPHTPDGERFYAQLAGATLRDAALPPMNAEAVALCIEEGARSVADQDRLSAILSDLRDLALEAGSIARSAMSIHTPSVVPASDSTCVTHGHVLQALAARERRMNLAAEQIDDLMREDVILIDTGGEAVGQINGLTVLLSGAYAFGMPARITARTAPGRAGIINIERETMMSGPAHSKGILVLGGYLAGRFARKQPLSLSATICLEQVYGEIEGDSASSAELYALLSSLAGLPLKQALAVTGSVNQHGVVQAIGGVNEKIEGYFRLCAQRGLTGAQGVIIPRANVRNLMLRQEVIDAVRAGQFHLYAVQTIDEGIELLTGVSAGVVDAVGNFPADTVNGRVSQTLLEFTQTMREFNAPPWYAAEQAAESAQVRNLLSNGNGARGWRKWRG